MRLGVLAFCVVACGASRTEPPRSEQTPVATANPAPVVEVPSATPESDFAGAEAPTATASALPGRGDAGASLEARDPTGLAQVVARARGKFRACYREEQKTRPKLAAKLTIEIVVDPSGAVASAREKGSAQSDPALAACVLDVVRKLEFDAASEPSTVNLPFNFVPPP